MTVSKNAQANALDQVDRAFKQNVMIRAREVTGLRPQAFAHKLHEVMGLPTDGQEWRAIHVWEHGDVTPPR